MATLPRNVKEMMEQLRTSTQGALSARMSRLAVEMPVGFEFGLEGERAKRKGSTKVLTSADIARSNRELARLYVGMFEGTGLVPLVLFPSASSKKGKRGKAKLLGSPPLERVPASAEVVLAVAPLEPQLRELRQFCEASGMDKLVILLNARPEDMPSDARAFFAEAGDGGFQTAYTFLTQPLGVDSSRATAGGDPLVLWKAYPGEWLFARKPAIGPPRELWKQGDAPGRPSVTTLEAAVEAEAAGGGMLGGLFG